MSNKIDMAFVKFFKAFLKKKRGDLDCNMEWSDYKLGYPWSTAQHAFDVI